MRGFSHAKTIGLWRLTDRCQLQIPTPIQGDPGHAIACRAMAPCTRWHCGNSAPSDSRRGQIGACLSGI